MGWSVFDDTFLVATEPQSTKSVYWALLETSRNGFVFFESSNELSQRVKVNLYCTRPKSTPFPPTFLSWRPPRANVALDFIAHFTDWQGTSIRTAWAAPFSKGSMRYHVGQRTRPVSHHSQAAFVSCFVS